MAEASNSGRAIDLVHLARQSLGDKGLECELLALFERQAGQILARLSAGPAALAPKAKADLAHTLKGSALAVGANRVAEAAAAFEDAALPGPGHEAAATDRQMQALRVAVDEARRAVAGLLAA